MVRWLAFMFICTKKDMDGPPQCWVSQKQLVFTSLLFCFAVVSGNEIVVLISHISVVCTFFYF